MQKFLVGVSVWMLLIGCINGGKCVMAAELVNITERGNLNESSSSISGDVITIQPQLYDGDWLNFYFKITGANTWQPDFECVWTGHLEYSVTTADSNNLYPRYTYTPDNPSSWVNATAVSNDGTNLTWTFPSAFTSDTVYVALYPIVTPSMILTWITGLSGISEPASAVAYGGDDYQYGVVAQVTDVNSRVIPAQKQYCFKFGSGAKVAVIFGGVHASEDLGSIMMMEAIDFLLSSSLTAVQARADYTFYIYPMINPQGRYGGQQRNTFETGEETTDPNRDWDDSTGFDLVCTGNTKDAVAADVTVADIDLFMDFHSKVGQAELYRNNSTANTDEVKFYGFLESYQTILDTTSYPTTADSTREYYGLTADLAWTAEIGHLSYLGDKSLSATILGEAVGVSIAKLQWALYTSNRTDGIDFGNDNATRYYKIPSNSVLALPDDDWTIGFWGYVEDNSDNYYQYILSIGTYGAANSMQIFIRESGISTPNKIQINLVDGSSSTATSQGALTAGDSKKKLYVFQRETLDDGTFELNIYVCDEGGNIVQVANEVLAIDGVAAGDLYIGARTGLDADRFYEEHMGGLFKADVAFEMWDIEQIAWGLKKPSDIATMQLDLLMDSPDATLTDTANALTATQYGSSWPTPSIDFVQPAESLLPINLSDTVTMSDIISSTVGTSMSDTITLSDIKSSVVGTSISDTVTLSDIRSGVSGFVRTYDDTVTLSDIRSAAVGTSRADTVTLSDIIDTLIAITLALADTVILSDSMTKRPGPGLSDTFTLSDIRATVSEFVRTYDDTVTLSDSAARAVGLTHADIVALSDAMSTSTAVIYALVSFLASNRKFIFTASNRKFNIIASNRKFNIIAKQRGVKYD